MKTWNMRVQQSYASLEELKGYDEIFGVVARCGFESAQEMWDANPMIGGSTNPSDFGRVEEETSPSNESKDTP